MASFEITGQDGSTYQIEAPNEGAALAALNQHLGVPAVPRETPAPSMTEGLVREAAKGVPVAGGLANKLDAATNAALAPLLDKYLPDSFEKLPEDTFGERYAHALAIQNQKDAAFEKAHPVASTTAQVAGSLGSVGAALKAAPTVAPRVLGLTGKTLPAQVMQGAGSSAALSAADALTRDDVDPGKSAEIGALTGAVIPVGGRLIGKGIEALGMARRPPPVPANVDTIAGVPVRQSLGQATGDADAITREQMALRGADNSREGAVARDFFDQQKDELEQAQRAIAQRLGGGGDVTVGSGSGAARVAPGGVINPGHGIVAETPQDAASVISDALASRAQTTFQTEQAAAQRAAAADEALRSGLSPTGSVLASSPTEAANIMSGAISNAAERAQAAKRQAYQALDDSDVVFHPAAFNGAGAKIKTAVDAASKIDINPESTPVSNRALTTIDKIVGSLGQQRDEAGKVMPSEPITPSVIDDVRKRLNVMMGEAKAAAQAGKPSDAIAMREIIDQFDNLVEDRVAKGTVVQGNPLEALSQMRLARGLNTAYRQNFTPQGAGDEVGRAIQSIVGRYDGQAAPSEQIRSMLYGNGALPVKIAQRLKTMFGADSPEIGAVKQGLFSHLTEDATGAKLAPEKAASNVEGFLRNSTLAQTYLSPEERQGFADYAARQRASVKAPPTDVETVAARIASGQMSPTDVVHALMTTKGVGRTVRLAQKIKTDFGEGSREWAAVKQGIWAKLNENSGGPLDVGSRKVVSALTDFLDGDGKPLSHVAFTADERDLLRSYRDLMQRITPPPGTVNYSNTSTVLGKMFRGALDGIFGLGGLHVAGPLGMAAGYAADAGQRAIRDTVRAAKVAKLLYGTPQSARAISDLQASLGRMSAIAQRAAAPRLASDQ